MSRGLVSLAEGHLVFGNAVSRVADSLSPLGAAARIVAESYACLATMRELQLAGRQARDDHDARMEVLQRRRDEASTSLRQMRRRVGQSELTAQDLRRCIVDMQKQLVRRGVPLAEKQLYLHAIRDFGDILLTQHAQQGDELYQAIDSVLNGQGAATRTVVPQARRGNDSRRGKAPARRG